MPDLNRTNPLVLLVDGEEDSAKSFQSIFAKVAIHWQQVHVKDGGEAVHHMIYHGFPDLVVTKCHSPKLNASDLVEWVRTMKCPRPIPFIIWDKIIPREMQVKLNANSGIDYLHQAIPEVRLKKALMQIVVRTEMTLFSHAARAE